MQKQGFILDFLLGGGGGGGGGETFWDSKQMEVCKLHFSRGVGDMLPDSSTLRLWHLF